MSNAVCLPYESQTTHSFRESFLQNEIVNMTKFSKWSVCRLCSRHNKALSMIMVLRNLFIIITLLINVHTHRSNHTHLVLHIMFMVPYLQCLFLFFVCSIFFNALICIFFSLSPSLLLPFSLSLSPSLL